MTNSIIFFISLLKAAKWVRSCIGMQQSAETLLSVLLFTSFIVYLLQKMLKFLRAFLTSSSILFDRKMRSVTYLTILYQYRRSMKLCTGLFLYFSILSFFILCFIISGRTFKNLSISILKDINVSHMKNSLRYQKLCNVTAIALYLYLSELSLILLLWQDYIWILLYMVNRLLTFVVMKLLPLFSA